MLVLSVQEPVAFVGGMFAGLLRLDLNDDPLKEWVTRTVEAAGITEDEIGVRGSKPEEVPEQIEIEWPGFHNSITNVFTQNPNENQCHVRW